MGIGYPIGSPDYIVSYIGYGGRPKSYRAGYYGVGPNPMGLGDPIVDPSYIVPDRYPEPELIRPYGRLMGAGYVPGLPWRGDFVGPAKPFAPC